MIVFTFILLFMVVLNIRMQRGGGDAFNFATTESIKGIGIIIVFFDHFFGYIEKENFHEYDHWFVVFYEYITKYMVALFLLFSGYGVTLSIINKGAKYIRSIPRRRIFQTLVNFDIAILIFLLVDILLGINYPYKTIALSLVGWESIGNSNWYIFAILYFYISSYFASITSNDNIKNLLILLLLSMMYIISIGMVKQPWWSNVAIAYFIGCLYASNKNSINYAIRKHYYLILFVTVLTFIPSFLLSSNIIVCNLSAIAFCLLTLLICTKFSLNSRVLGYLGRKLFPIYIYQRIPMIVIAYLYPNLTTEHPYIYLFLCFILTLAFASVMFMYKSPNQAVCRTHAN